MTDPVYPNRTDTALDIPERHVTRTKSTLIPGIKDEHLIIAGVLVSGIVSFAALSQTPAVQNLIRRFTGQKEVQGQDNQQNQPAGGRQSRVVNAQQQQGFQIISEEEQQRQAAAIAAQYQAQEAQRQKQINEAAAQRAKASMYDNSDPNTIRVDPYSDRKKNERYSSPFGAKFAS